MATLTDEQLQKSLKQDGLQPVYLLYGAETRLLQNTVKKIQSQGVTPGFEAFNLQTFDETCTADQLQTAYEALPMMAPQKVVIVRDFNVTGLAKADLQLVMDMLQTPNPSTVLVLYYTDAEYDPKKKAASKKLMELVAKVGIVCAFALKDRATLKKALLARCKKANTPMEPAVCDLLLDRCGLQYGTLQTEIEKLISYADGKAITAQDVESLCVQSFQNTAFDLCNAVVKGQYATAYHILDHLIYQRVEPMALIGALTMSFGDLYRAKAGQVAGIPLSQVVTEFKYGRASFRVTKYQSLLSSFSIAKVRHCVLALEQANQHMISSKVDSRVLLEQMLGQMLAYPS